MPESLFYKSLFIIKETLAQVFSCEFCEISKNTFFHRTPPVVASVHSFDALTQDEEYFQRNSEIVFYASFVLVHYFVAGEFI